jgi:hypothetical protein
MEDFGFVIGTLREQMEAQRKEVAESSADRDRAVFLLQELETRLAFVLEQAANDSLSARKQASRLS